MIAGEPSGDVLGGSVLKSIKSVAPESEVIGIGGLLMQKQGLNSLFDIREISVGGIVELIPHIIKIKKLIQRTVDDILSQKPDVVVTIDSPGFCFRVAKMIRKKNPDIRLIHYVAPTVWAWRPKRAKKIAKIYDHLLTLFDFEPQYFTKEGLQTTFVGHTAIEENASLNSEGKTHDILVMPGSRVQEIKKLLPIFLAAAVKIRDKKNYQERGRIIIPTLPHLKQLVMQIVGYHNVVVIDDDDHKTKAFQTAGLALVASGTATLQLSLCGCPMIVAYRMSKMSYEIIRRMTFSSVRFISLANIVMDDDIVPELIQDDCTVQNIIDRSETLDKQNQIERFKELRVKLCNNGCEPSFVAANIILDKSSDIPA